MHTWAECYRLAEQISHESPETETATYRYITDDNDDWHYAIVIVPDNVEIDSPQDWETYKAANQ